MPIVITPIVDEEVTSTTASIDTAIDQMLANVQNDALTPQINYTIDGESYNKESAANSQLDRMKKLMDLQADMEGPFELEYGAF